MWAILKNNEKIVKLLLSLGANKYYRTKNTNKTALDLAILIKNKSIVQLIE